MSGLFFVSKLYNNFTKLPSKCSVMSERCSCFVYCLCRKSIALSNIIDMENYYFLDVDMTITVNPAV